MEIGEDGRPDFAARKSCNYMESAIQVYDKIGVELQDEIMEIMDAAVI